MPDDDPANEGGHVVWVAIADVAWYVRPGSALDREARVRGNSTYFPDRVAPMLPEALSADLCSLHEDVDRPCMELGTATFAAASSVGARSMVVANCVGACPPPERRVRSAPGRWSVPGRR